MNQVSVAISNNFVDTLFQIHRSLLPSFNLHQISDEHEACTMSSNIFSDNLSLGFHHFLYQEEKIILF